MYNNIQDGPTGTVGSTAASIIQLQAASITITPVQITNFQTLLNTLDTKVNLYFQNGSYASALSLADFLYKDLFTFLDEFPYQGVIAYSQYMIIGAVNLLDIQTTFPGQPSQVLQQLYDALSRFIDQLILDTVPYNQLMTSLLTLISTTSIQPVTSSIPVTDEETTALLNFTHALVTQVFAFFSNPTATNNQNLQNLFIQFFIFFRDYSIQDYAVYGRFLSGEILQTLNVSPVLLGKLSSLLQAFYGELSVFTERLFILTSSYNQILGDLAEAVSITASFTTGTGVTGPTGATGAMGPQGLQGPTGAAGTIEGAKPFDPNNTSSYQTGDIVTYNGGLYLVDKDAPSGTPGSSSDYTSLVSAGATGPTGATGLQGPKGDAGPASLEVNSARFYRNYEPITVSPGSIVTYTKANFSPTSTITESAGTILLPPNGVFLVSVSMTGDMPINALLQYAVFLNNEQLDGTTVAARAEANSSSPWVSSTVVLNSSNIPSSLQIRMVPNTSNNISIYFNSLTITQIE